MENPEAMPYLRMSMKRIYFIWKRIDEIKYVVVDERVPYEYKIDGLDGCVCGEILVPPNATDQYIRKLIMDDLKILYRKA